MNAWELVKENTYVMISLLLVASFVSISFFFLPYLVIYVTPPDVEITDGYLDAMPTMSLVAFVAVFIATIPIFLHTLITPAIRIMKLKNIETRMKKLRKLGTEKFIQVTKSEFINANNRGVELYQSKSIIKDTTVKFLVYRDTSTNEPYISFVQPGHETADEAMAWKDRLSVEQYRRMKSES